MQLSETGGIHGRADRYYCTTTDGTTPALKNMPCAMEWDECVGKDAVSGVTPQGCACPQRRVSGQLFWNCPVDQPVVQIWARHCKRLQPGLGIWR